MSSPRRPGRMLLSSRVPTPSSPDESHRGEGQTPQPSGPFRPPSPPSTPPSPPITPLTPRNTFASDGDGDIFDLEFGIASGHGSDLDLRHLDVELLERTINDSDDDLMEDEDEVDARPCDTRSEPPPDTSGSSNDTVIHTRPAGPQRSKSVPPRPLKSALAAPTPPTTTTDSERCGRKRAHFDEDPLTAEFRLRYISPEPTLVRRCSTPERISLMTRILSRDSFSEHAQSIFTDSSNAGHDEELASAIELFEEVVEELVQVAEEHAEAHEELAGVAHEVAEAIFKGRRGTHKPKDVTEGNEVDQDDVPDRSNSASSPRLVQQSPADKDVDESCFADPEIRSSSDNDDQIGPEILLWPDGDEHEEARPLLITKERNTSTETLLGPSTAGSEPPVRRRESEPQPSQVEVSRFGNVRRRNSMTDFTKLKGRLKLLPASSKAGPAGCAVTVCTVRAVESPKLNTVYENPGARFQMLEGDLNPSKMAQTVRSDAGTLQVLWIEPTPVSSSSDVTLLDSAGQFTERLISDNIDFEIARTPSPMDKVKTKLAAWSWAREQGLEGERGGPNWIPLLSCNEDLSLSHSGLHSPPSDEPFAPPNTERPSGASSAKHSAPHTPGPEEQGLTGADDDEEDHPLELKVKTTSTRPLPIPASLRKNQGDYLTLPKHQSQSTPGSESCQTPTKPISRELSNLPSEDMHFKTHKNSLVLLHKRKDEGKMNQQLMNSRDSILLAHSKLDMPYPKSFLDTKSAWSPHGPLSPIRDASPPDPRTVAGSRAMEKAMKAPQPKDRRPRPKFVDGLHPDEHVGCPICETERPRWFEANCKKGHFM